MSKKGQVAAPGISPMPFSYYVFRFVNVPHSLITNKFANLVPRALFAHLGALRT